MRYLAIDPGSTESAYALIDSDRRPIDFGKINNLALRETLPELSKRADRCAIEMVASYGMAVGAEVFDTCVWIGRFTERCNHRTRLTPIFRREVKLHHCCSAAAKDSNIVQALVDRFAYGRPNRGKGTKAEPGWFHGFHDDIWQAYALAVYVADMSESMPARSPVSWTDPADIKVVVCPTTCTEDHT